MPAVALLFPRGPSLATGDLLDGLRRPPADGPLVVGDERAVDFLAQLARRLLRPALARRFPEFGPLGFLLRRSELSQVLNAMAAPAGAVRRPRGLVLHLTPSNVDTVFVYSWAYAVLAGNTNIVRVSSRSSDASAALLDALNQTAASVHPAITQTQRVVAYPRDDTITGALSAASDLRVLWGGDATVDAVRRLPIPARSRDLTFPDRSSLAAIRAEAWLSASLRTRQAVARAFYNDAYWFDQAACSSPRAIYWIGEPPAAESAQREFYRLLLGIVSQRPGSVDTAMAVQQRVASYGLAIDGAATGITFHHSALTTVDLAAPEAFPRQWLGVGCFPQATVPRLNDLAPVMTPRDQTIAYFGFTYEELAAFVQAIPGLGIDRVVPIGEALRFTRTWDGYDLLTEFTRLTTIAPPREWSGET